MVLILFIKCSFPLQVVLPLRVVLLALMLLCNAFMITLFVRSMQYCSSTAEATIVNNAANLLTTVNKNNYNISL